MASATGCTRIGRASNACLSQKSAPASSGLRAARCLMAPPVRLGPVAHASPLILHSSTARLPSFQNLQDASKPAFSDGNGTENMFNCASRKATEWDETSRKGAARHIQMEECWESGKAYYDCINKVLSVVGLHTDSLAESLKLDASGKLCIEKDPTRKFRDLNYNCNETSTKNKIEKHVACNSVSHRARGRILRHTQHTQPFAFCSSAPSHVPPSPSVLARRRQEQDRLEYKDGKIVLVHPK